jgi:CRISPR-associated protein Cas1
MIAMPLIDAHDPPVRVMALHALAYCRRLFYLESIENRCHII